MDDALLTDEPIMVGSWSTLKREDVGGDLRTLHHVGTT